MFLQEEELSDKIRDVQLEVERAEDQSARLFEELGCTPEELEAYLNDRNNFSPEEWAALKEQEQRWNERLKRELDQVAETGKRTFPARHWMPM
jgi:hypothetical protein